MGANLLSLRSSDVSPALNDYFARLSYALSRGFRQPHVMVWHNARLGYWRFNGSPQPCQEETERAETLHRWLAELKYEYDLGEETLLRELAIMKPCGYIQVRHLAYEMVILPPETVLTRQRLLMLLKGLDQACELGEPFVVLVLHEPGSPPCVWEEGRETAETTRLIQHSNVRCIPFEKEALAQVLLELDYLPTAYMQDVQTGLPCDEIDVQHRRQGKYHQFFFVNVSDRASFQPEVTLPLRRFARPEWFADMVRGVQVWSCESGDSLPLQADVNPDGLRFQLPVLEPGRAALILLDTDPVVD
jgi:hypothetical protein